MNVVYFHGIPGGPSELTLFGNPKASGPHLLVIDRCAEAIGADFPAMLDQIENRIHSTFGSQSIALVGFSLGARPALEIAARLADRVVRVDLVSAAAPLACGVALRDMAGGSVFGLAASSPALFSLLASVQQIFARICPTLLVRLLFAGARGMDRDLARQAAYRAGLADLIRQSFVHGSAGYRREIVAYAPVGSFRQHGCARTHSRNGRVEARFCRFTGGPPCQKPGWQQLLL